MGSLSVYNVNVDRIVGNQMGTLLNIQSNLTNIDSRSSGPEFLFK